MLAAVMTATAFLSLFMSNTATAALMVPLVLPIIKSFESNKQEIELAPLETSVDTEEQQEEEKKTPLTGQRDGSVDREMAHVQYGKSLLLAVAYSASLGGVGTLIGTGPNVALVQLLRVLFPRNEGISFAAWMGFALVIVIVALVILWGLLVFVVNRKGMYLVRFPTSWAGEMEAQKRISYEEIVVLVALIIASVLWLTRSGIPPALPGWGQTHFGKLIGDGTVCVAVSCALFLIPSINKPGRKIMEASAIASLHWDVIILLGAGFAIGHAFVSSGLTLWIGLQVRKLNLFGYFFSSFFSLFYLAGRSCCRAFAVCGFGRFDSGLILDRSLQQRGYCQHSTSNRRVPRIGNQSKPAAFDGACHYFLFSCIYASGGHSAQRSRHERRSSYFFRHGAIGSRDELHLCRARHWLVAVGRTDSGNTDWCRARVGKCDITLKQKAVLVVKKKEKSEKRRDRFSYSEKAGEVVCLIVRVFLQLTAR